MSAIFMNSKQLRLFSSPQVPFSSRRAPIQPSSFGVTCPRKATISLSSKGDHAGFYRQQRNSFSSLPSSRVSELTCEDEETMEMKINIISRENIKPCSPTPSHLRTYKFSILDQLMNSVYVPLVFFYPNNDQNPNIPDIIRQRTLRLKQSLSKTLTRFYPFAGELRDNALFIECNDRGIFYAEARVNGSLWDFLRKPDYKLIHRLLPLDPNSNDSLSGSYIVKVQINVFECGGIAISMCTSHKIIDGQTYITFLRAWAAASQDQYGSEVVNPSFIAQCTFPQNDSLPEDSSLMGWPAMFKRDKFVTRRVVFESSDMALLKAEAKATMAACNCTTPIRNPSRVEAVTSLIWKVAAKSAGARRPSVMSVAVNLRRKRSPPLHQHSIGNILWSAVARWDPTTDSQTLIRRLRTAIEKIDDNFVHGIEGELGFQRVKECLNELGQMYSNDQTDYYAVTSICNMGLYDADFGWGKPIWSCIGNANAETPVLTNLIFIMDRRYDDGVEAWVTLNEQDMNIFEHDSELLTFASLDPSPLKFSPNHYKKWVNIGF